MRQILDPKNYDVVWIAPLEIEARVAALLMDDIDQGNFQNGLGHDISYVAGTMCGHKVVIASIPSGRAYGTASAASLATQIKNDFPYLRIGLLVGIAAGLPRLSDDNKEYNRDIRLGDVILAQGTPNASAVVAYDLGKATPSGFIPLQEGNSLAKTAEAIMSAVGKIKAEMPSPLTTFYENLNLINNRCAGTEESFKDPGQSEDELHMGGKRIERIERTAMNRTKFWYGRLGSGEKVIKDERKRNELRDAHDILGLEMEAAGVMNTIPVGVIRGVCDYGDERKNKIWQPYAAATAGAYAKMLLSRIAPRSNNNMSQMSLVQSVRVPIQSQMPSIPPWQPRPVRSVQVPPPPDWGSGSGLGLASYGNNNNGGGEEPVTSPKDMINSRGRILGPGDFGGSRLPDRRLWVDPLSLSKREEEEKKEEEEDLMTSFNRTNSRMRELGLEAFSGSRLPMVPFHRLRAGSLVSGEGEKEKEKEKQEEDEGPMTPFNRANSRMRELGFRGFGGPRLSDHSLWADPPGLREREEEEKKKEEFPMSSFDRNFRRMMELRPIGFGGSMLPRLPDHSLWADPPSLREREEEEKKKEEYLMSSFDRNFSRMMELGPMGPSGSGLPDRGLWPDSWTVRPSEGERAFC